jgi:hypothetical protein
MIVVIKMTIVIITVVMIVAMVVMMVMTMMTMVIIVMTMMVVMRVVIIIGMVVVMRVMMTVISHEGDGGVGVLSPSLRVCSENVLFSECWLPTSRESLTQWIQAWGHAPDVPGLRFTSLGRFWVSHITLSRLQILSHSDNNRSQRDGTTVHSFEICPWGEDHTKRIASVAIFPTGLSTGALSRSSLNLCRQRGRGGQEPTCLAYVLFVRGG